MRQRLSNMSLIDSLLYLSAHQTIEGKTYSSNRIKIQGVSDWGNGGWTRHIKIVAHGPNTLGDLEIKLLAYKEGKINEATVIGTTGVITQADIVQGSTFWITLNITGIAYDNLCLLYDQQGGTEATDAMDEAYCPIVPMLHQDDEQENTYTAFMTLDRTDNVPYEVNNQDKVFL